MENGRSHFFAYEDFPRQDLADGEHDFLCRLLLGQVAARPCAKRPFTVQRFIVHGEHQYGEFRVFFLELFDQFDAVGVLQRDINDGEVGLAGIHRQERFPRILSFSADV